MSTGEASTPPPARLCGTDNSENEEDGDRRCCSNEAPDGGRDGIARKSDYGPVWIYDQKLNNHRHHCQFAGRIITIHGSEADRLRNQFAEIIDELLAWAAREQEGGQFQDEGKAA
ncbi:hypothetical protein ABZ942_13435 [Nocardia sp. NPDC046473]|uniref:hypothetical protein n=1 Tax=Nocardia sp. NPDC046473 TaxID=3155733 RepID=UPI00340D0ACF